MEEVNKVATSKLEKKLGYVFLDKSLLQQSLTRENAIQEHVRGAAPKSYQALEFVGDAALKHCIARLLFQKYGNEWTEAQLHDETTRLIGNKGILPQIADQLELTKFIICGKGEKVVTSDMKADMLEALIGAISMDNPTQRGLFGVIDRLWRPHIAKVSIMDVAQKPTVKAGAPTVILPRNNKKVMPDDEAPSSPRTLRIFDTLSSLTPLEQFEAVVSQASNVNGRNKGKNGDTPLMTLLGRKKFRKGNEVPRVEILLKYGALWEAPNNLGKTADDVARAKGIDPGCIARLKTTSLKK